MWFAFNYLFLYLIILPIGDIYVLFFLFFKKKTKKQKNKFAGEPGQKQKKKKMYPLQCGFHSTTTVTIVCNWGQSFVGWLRIQPSGSFKNIKEIECLCL
jgi:hypothetical protein